MEMMISSSPAVRRELEGFELMQIWIQDPVISPLDVEQRARMKELVGNFAIPLHVILDPDTGEVIATADYGNARTPEAYLEFLAKAKR